MTQVIMLDKASFIPTYNVRLIYLCSKAVEVFFGVAPIVQEQAIKCSQLRLHINLQIVVGIMSISRIC